MPQALEKVLRGWWEAEYTIARAPAVQFYLDERQNKVQARLGSSTFSNSQRDRADVRMWLISEFQKYCAKDAVLEDDKAETLRAGIDSLSIKNFPPTEWNPYRKPLKQLVKSLGLGGK